MAMVPGDWEVLRSTGAITYTGGDHASSPTYATVIEFHRWLQDLADQEDSNTSDDQIDITDPTPSERSTDNIIKLINGFFITDVEAEHLYDGSIIQGTAGVDQIIWDGFVNFGNADVQIQIHQDGAVLADDWWNFGGAGLNASASAGISHRFMLKVHDFVADGGDIDGRRLLGTTRTFGKTYGEFYINGTSRGNNVFALVDSNDLNNETIEGTVSGWTGITNTTEGFAQIDVDNDGGAEDYYSEWNTNQPTRTTNEFYERMKWLTRDGSASTLYGLNGELFRGITHEIHVDNQLVSTFAAFEEVTWTEATIPSSGQMLAVDSTTVATKMWIQLLTGIAPTDGTTITANSTTTVDVDTTVTPRTISKPFIGASTGSAIIGAYGVGIEKADLTSADLVFDLTDTPVPPPNNVVFTVFGMEIGDKVLVTNDQATGIDYDQFTLNGAHTTAMATVTVNEVVPLDTPQTGSIRVISDTGTYYYNSYDSWAVKTFNITSTLPEDSASGNNAFLGYIDKTAAATEEAVTLVYQSPRTMFVRVREGSSGTPIKTFETTGVLGPTGGSATAQRTDDY